MGNVEEQARKDFSEEKYLSSGKVRQSCEEKKSDTQKALDGLYLVAHTLGDKISDLRLRLGFVMLSGEPKDSKEPDAKKFEPASSLVRQIRECSDLLGNVDCEVEDILKRLQV